ncbi:conserved hypothetical protein [Hyphomicrobiales bacterium]|nr:conserved hypothetical protein [Hyphomicrobiales bacterium]CAH1697796.1 conserved hypothetical protein [Hyphomicrobiales bacterium]CAI0347442.1 DUF1801 domain-containing protein [Hyphomicrobiales bacterium]
MVRKTTRRPKATENDGGPAKPVLLSGGNPQIPKGEGHPAVQAYIAAMPGWKRDVGLQLDALIERSVPGLRKAVKWNSPLYGTHEQGWFLGIHCFTRYIKIAFFNGAALEPQPPVASKDKNTRYLHIDEAGLTDEATLVRWIEQAAKLPGWVV